MKHRVIAISIGLLIVAAVVGGVVYWEWGAGSKLIVGPPPAAAKPAITWSPASLDETISPSDTKTVEVLFTPSEDLANVALKVVPELQPFVQASPLSFPALVKGQTVSVQLTVSAVTGSPLGTFEGTVHLVDGSGTRRLARPLSVVVRVWQRISEPISGITLIVPPDLITAASEDNLIFARTEAENLPPLFVVYVIDTPLEISGLPLEEALEEIAKRQLGEDFIGVVGFHDGGVEVEARTFTRRHFFLYDPSVHRAVEFASGHPDFFSSDEFSDIVHLISF